MVCQAVSGSSKKLVAIHSRNAHLRPDALTLDCNKSYGIFAYHSF